MGTRTEKELGQEDIKSYLVSSSDFSFELKVLNGLRQLDFQCEHGGTYTDPVTGKSRQFDIRASFDCSVVRLRLAVECKNIQGNCPLVAHCIPRKEHEAWNSVIRCQTIPDNQTGGSRRWNGHIHIVTMTGRGSIYGSNDRKYVVCKSLAQAWEEVSNGKKHLTGRDEEIYEKWSQAISSCFDLVRDEGRYHARNPSAHFEEQTFVIPVVVVPSGVLWRADYHETGEWTKDVQQANHVSLYIGKGLAPWDGVEDYGYLRYTISHVEIVEEDALADLKTRLIKSFTENRFVERFS